MHHSAKLDEYPGLARWYHDHAGRPPRADETADTLVLRTCEALQVEKASGVRLWLDSFQKFLGASKEPLGDFLQAQATVNGCDAELLDLIGELGESAVRSGLGESFHEAMRRGADATGLVVMRFLSAWTALNMGHLEDCVEDCELVDEPFAALYTVQGQALLELGRATEAVDVLNVATGLAPGEILAWFQKAKALHLLGRQTEAFAALRECQRLAPQSEEIALFMAMVASAEGGNRELREQAWSSLRPHLSRLAHLPPITLGLLRLATQLADKSRAHVVLTEARWPDTARGPESIKELAGILKLLHDAGWMDVSAQLLAQVVPQQKQGA